MIFTSANALWLPNVMERIFHLLPGVDGSGGTALTHPLNQQKKGCVSESVE